MADLTTKLTTTWTGLIQGGGRMASETVELPIAIPRSYGGTGAGSHPKELLMASATACYVMTLAGMMAARNLPLADVSVSSELSEVSKQTMQIVHEISVVLAAEASPEQIASAESLVEAADKSCMVGNLLRTAGVQVSILSGKVTIA
ncbi:OsmC family protein [Comamonas sp. Y6]|uniref:OsmC family protein n=1 Tax=Comamonas resistens TaxID=3046670 RepID=A0ABY8SRY1_9BURK|nr:OsmC family protein [Comamonas resistens]MDL5035843.1 OsmC family protein [Comamonas resistens]WHS65251.1 OsmC family protein [Comamonas resistens]HBP0978959.1 hypothetical protein [Pseudomonas aeruginosa]